MVEKSKPASGLAKGSVDEQRATGGILKKVARSLDSVPETRESPMIQGHDTSDSTPTERNQLTAKEEETAKFKSLCEGVQNQLALFQVSMVELLALKDELLKHALPPSLLVKVALVTSKLFRGASDLAIPVNELVRLVKLYSAPWESKSAALKKLHEDYENKQRQLNVALQKLVLVGIQADRMSQERRVLNWERLFTRIMTSKAHGYRWKFLIETFKKKIKTGEIYEAGASTDEDTQKEKARNERQLETIRRKSMNKDTTAKRIMKEAVTIEGAKSSVLTSAPEKEIKDVHVSSEDDIISDIDVSVNEEEQLTLRQRSADQSTGINIDVCITRKGRMSPQQLFPSKPETKPHPKISFSFKPPSDDDDDDDSDDNKSTGKPGLFQVKRTQNPAVKRTGRAGVQFAEEKPRAKPKSRLRGVKFFSPSDDEEEDIETQQKQPAPTPVVAAKIITEDKECWTNEPDSEKFLHVRLYRPVCKKADSPCCTVVFMGHALKTNSYDPPLPPETPIELADRITVQDVNPGDLDQSLADTSTSLEEPPRFEELLFKLPDSNGYAPGEKPIDLSDEQVKVAIHPSPQQPMVAMAAIRYGDLKILDQFEGRWSHTDFTNEIQSFPLMSTVSARDMPFGSECGHVPVVCYMSKVESPKMISTETETESFEQLIRNEIEERRKAEEQEREAAMRGVSPTRYTESEFQSIRGSHAEEIQALHEEYERRLNELAQGLDSYSGNEEGMREFVHAATSPLLIRSPSPVQSSASVQSTLRTQSAMHSSQGAELTPRPPADGRATTSSRKARPRIPNLPAWGKDLPQDFLVRLDMFNENSEKYRLELEDKTKKAIQQKYELQMAVQNRLSIPDDEHFPQQDVCLPAVFMPTKTGLVFTPKAHSYFHPPGSSEGRLTQPPSVFKLPHLADMSTQVSVLNLFDMGQRFTPSQAQPQQITSGIIPQTAPPPPHTHDMDSSHVYTGRACTR